LAHVTWLAVRLLASKTGSEGPKHISAAGNFQYYYGKKKLFVGSSPTMTLSRLGHRIRASELSVPNHRFGKKLSFCHFKSCSHHEFIRILQFLPIRSHRLTVMCCEFCPQIGTRFRTPPNTSERFIDNSICISRSIK
jgi:hypothetical protein